MHERNVMLQDDADALTAALERRQQPFWMQALEAHVLEREQQQQQQAELEEEDAAAVSPATVESIR